MPAPKIGLVGSSGPFRSFAIALQFLTIVPIRVCGPLSTGELGGSLVFFPVIGALIGGILALAGSTLITVTSSLLAAAIVVALGLVLTGLLHFDGLLDTVDGLFGGANSEDRLAIMRDSRVGSFAVAAGACDILIRLAAVNALFELGAFMGIVWAAAASRVAMAYAVTAFKPARDSGFSVDFRAGVKPITVIIAGLLILVLGYATVGPASLALIVGSLVLAHVTGMLAVSKVGGLTGDIYGAVNEIVEVATLVALALLWPMLSGPLR